MQNSFIRSDGPCKEVQMNDPSGPGPGPGVVHSAVTYVLKVIEYRQPKTFENHFLGLISLWVQPNGREVLVPLSESLNRNN